MSVVAFRNGRMASDSRAYGGSWQASPGSKQKIHRLPDGSLVGLTSGKLGEPDRFLAWLKSGADRAEWKGDPPDVRALMVKLDGTLWLADCSLVFSGPITAEFYAIGSGADFALGAMSHGADAEHAVGVAIALCPHCGGPIHTVDL
jgi:hypothetical protein